MALLDESTKYGECLPPPFRALSKPAQEVRIVAKCPLHLVGARLRDAGAAEVCGAATA